ncbi:uncharacterized protein UMAG_10302 [Mycosarcoma maydis]|uniref:DSC E3 ubiquitin ligase complex subunit 3 C-terminal domain-containing protein n=1 Tax=Mycosarcoma maydis TaxID=5270 RepID=A0A0D1C6U0_MYCMD|nr:uncharacterized protein UMAG_10302 [Ustilago maydis 521]KIS69307.1 hypothetical protein UMAG_10302 [Ustilago maydis 521]|eukprot:XP_011389185.1 hypothetical protein UMAG_10302 [Ustilago maydis 521]
MELTQRASDGIHLDVGQGSSSPPPTLQADIRVRPITIRFTEPGVRDLRLHLHSITSLRAVPFKRSDIHVHSGRPEQRLIFDFDTEDQQTVATRAPTSHQEDFREEDELVRDVIESLSADGLMGGDSSRQTLRDLALDDDAHRAGKSGVNDESAEHSDADEEARSNGLANEEDIERGTVEMKEMSLGEMVDWLSAKTNEVIRGDGSDDSGTTPFNAQEGGKGKKREPTWYSDHIRLTIRTARVVYIQCSVGELSTRPSHPLPSNALTNPLIDINSSDLAVPDAPEVDRSTSPTSRNRGFNRLLDAGLTHDEISTIRAQFRTSHPLHTSYDLIQEREHAQHLLEMEESWMDTFNATTNDGGGLGDFGEPASSAEAYTTVMQGLMVGFFVPPLIPLFWFRHKPHPSSLPSAAMRQEDDENDDDDEQQWEMECSEMSTESVFGSTMQISILYGLVANLIMGIFRYVW